MTQVRRFRPLVALFAILTALILVATDADARAGRGGSSGSRGSRTFTTTPPTTTAPTGGNTLQRTAAQPGQPSAASPGMFGGAFNRPGLFGGLLGGFLGAGLIGLLLGHGLSGGMGGIASVFGLLLQIALVVLVARLIWGWWQGGQTPDYAGGPMLRGMSPGPEGHGAVYGSGCGSAAAPPRPPRPPRGTDTPTRLRPRPYSALKSGRHLARNGCTPFHRPTGRPP